MPGFPFGGFEPEADSKEKNESSKAKGFHKLVTTPLRTSVKVKGKTRSIVAPATPRTLLLFRRSSRKRVKERPLLFPYRFLRERFSSAESKSSICL